MVAGRWTAKLTRLTLLTLAAACSLSWAFRPSSHAALSTRPGLGFRTAPSLMQAAGGAAIIECKDETCNFKEIVTSSGITVVDFYADWCGPCKIAAKTFAAIAEEFPDKSVKFVKVNTEAHEDTVEEFGLKGLPVFGVFKNGVLVRKHEGNIGKEKLLEFITTGINES
jgi:thioredoxin 1